MIYSDIASSSFVGNQVTDLFREFNYQRVGKGIQYFELGHIHYVPLQKHTLEIIKVEVSEVDGQLVQLGTGNTTITIHLVKQ